MTEMWDIAQYVEEHPEDYEQRWRLAKKLYTAWEYRLALEHLQILRNEWQRKLTVNRYLSATYYRLGRYDDAIAELESSIEIWPEEVGLHEQLARVLEIDGDRLRAADVWEQVQALEAHHPIAAKAVGRLREEEETSPQEDLRLSDSDSGIDLSPGQVCPNCGAQNSDEFERCWQCHFPLSTGQPTPRPMSRQETSKTAAITPETMSLGFAIAVLTLLTLSVYLTARMLLFGVAAESTSAVSTLWDVYNQELGVTRMLTGLFLLVFWPLALRVALALVSPPRPVPPPIALLTGLLLASLCYVGSWLPANLLFLVPLLAVAVSLTLILAVFGIGVARALTLWALHLFAVTAGVLLAVTLLESYSLGQFFNPVTEIPAIMRYSREQKASGQPGKYELQGTRAPVESSVTWRSTGSQWIDRRAGKQYFTVFAADEEAGLRFEIQDAGGTKLFEDVHGRQWSTNFEVTTGKQYRLIVNGTEGTPAQLVVSGLLVPQFAD